ncbi:hypothetical protein HY967_04660 [Candidatus Jorgensenbacteria bacterium]|nr:hypothetical protein [Candidatus Jorgensenbacteria bacterium]
MTSLEQALAIARGLRRGKFAKNLRYRPTPQIENQTRGLLAKLLNQIFVFSLNHEENTNCCRIHGKSP